MNILKSVYISTYITASVAGLATAILRMSVEGWTSAWFGTAVACAAPVLFFAAVFTLPIARTSPNLNAVLGAGLAGTALSVVLGGSLLSAATLVAAGVGVAGTLLYVHWYSRFASPTASVLTPGKALPDFPLVDHGKEVASATLVDKPALWIFYRGNWCPLCVAQIQEICAQYRELARRGIEVYLVSPQPEANTASLAARCDAPMRFLTDRGNRAAEALGILVKAGIPAGLQVLGYDSDAPRPTVFITDRGGRLVYCDLTDNYRVRPEPAQYLPILEKLATA
ncbi:MAG: peroxiredoxin family protein [Actinobacteria bacterium]|nr:peroxiredoxin family protein [Actinomycetota bacterium]